MITPDDLMAMIRHWLMTPPCAYLGSKYGSPGQDFLHLPLGTLSADQFLAKMRTDVRLLQLLPDDIVNLLGVPDGVDKLLPLVEIAGNMLPVDPQPGLALAGTLYETNTPPKLPTIPAFNTTATGLYISGSASAITFLDANRSLDIQSSSLVSYAILAMRPRKGGKYYFECKATKKPSRSFRSSVKICMSFSSNGNDLLINNNGTNCGVDYGAQGTISFQSGGGGSINYGTIPRLGTNPNGATVLDNSTVQMAVDSVAKKFWVGYEGAWIGGGNPATGVGPTGTMTSTGTIMCPKIIGSGHDSNAAVVTISLSTSQMKFAVPAGFQAWGDPDYAENDA